MSDRPSQTKKELRERLAAVLRDLMVEVDGKLERAIPYEHAKLMTADEVISLFHFDHGIHHAIGGPHVHWNYTARMIMNHRGKTHRVDRPQIRKTGRIADAHEEFQRRVLAKSDPDQTIAESDTKKRKWPSRPLQNPKGVKYQWGKRRAKERGQEGSRGEGRRGARDPADT